MSTALVETSLQDSALEPIRDKVAAGERLSFDDGVALYRSHDLLAVGHLANQVRERWHGDAGYFVRNTHINHTNVCAATCDFCAFAAKKGEPRAYTMGLDEIFRTVGGLPEAVREVHIVGGLHPDLPWSYFTDIIRGIEQARIDHLVRLRELQDETGGFVTYIPLAFQPWEAPAMDCPETTAFEDLKAIAVGRLMLDNFPHVKSYWIMIGPRLAQVGLSFGADDIDGTVTEEKIAHDAGAKTPQILTVHELVRLIREAGRRPIERDTVFNKVREW